MIASTQDRVEALRPRVNAYTPAELAEVLGSRDDVVLVDLRELQERIDSGAIAGAHHVPRGMLEFWADPQQGYFRAYFDPEKEIVVYCAGGHRSVLAAVTLMDMGYPRVSHLDTGFGGWAKDGQLVDDVAASSKWVRR